MNKKMQVNVKDVNKSSSSSAGSTVQTQFRPDSFCLFAFVHLDASAALERLMVCSD